MHDKNDLAGVDVKYSMFGDKVTIAEPDYMNPVNLAKKEIAAEHDTAAKDDEIFRLNVILQALNREKAVLIGERSELQKTIDRLRAKVMEFIEKFDLKEKLDKFLHPIKNMNKHR